MIKRRNEKELEAYFDGYLAALQEALRQASEGSLNVETIKCAITLIESLSKLIGTMPDEPPQNPEKP